MVSTIQVKGIIKYCQPKPVFVDSVNATFKVLYNYNTIHEKEFIKWVKDTNPVWLKYIKIKPSIIDRIIRKIIEKAKKVVKLF